MSKFARVVVESSLLQLDREFDFIVPAEFEANIQFGSRVEFTLGRSKKRHSGFVVKLLDASPHATSPLAAVVGNSPVLTAEIYQFSRKVANRQVTSIGEILSSAIPAHMPRIELPNWVPEFTFSEELNALLSNLDLNPGKSNRLAYLCSTKKISFAHHAIPEWIVAILGIAQAQLKLGKSAILIVPEIDDLQRVLEIAVIFGLDKAMVNVAAEKKSARFAAFHKALSQKPIIAVGLRNAVYAPVANLGAILVYDDLDESLREPGSPHTTARELALIRAEESTGVFFLAPYRSVEVQRLVEIGYLESAESKSAPVRFSFSESGQRLDSSSFKLIREALAEGPVLVTVPRKGGTLAAYCQNCGSKVHCDHCNSVVWSVDSVAWKCKACERPATKCHNCSSSNFKKGRAGSTRTAQEIGKSFPGTVVTEVTADKPLTSIRDRNQIVIATPGSISSRHSRFSAVVILDTDIWLSQARLSSEQLALRDWMESLQLLSNTGRAIAVGLPAEMGKTIALSRHVEFARESYREAKQLKLPPSVRVATVIGKKSLLDELLTQLIEGGAILLKYAAGTETDSAEISISFSYAAGPQVAEILRVFSLKSVPVLTKSGNRRGLQVIMDDQRFL